ncbi:MAG: tryptophan tryptophylquinone biosynthesis enzyme MauG [Pseudobdellovibrionaceae bacterium]|nr:hypothetical protein [Bdellovibrionales bacterium]USN47030.1 MAG: tryptophan tryptophylquinone biosynthesis enzyme MauG [Pseudobdellovibrionaceae bacterium]
MGLCRFLLFIALGFTGFFAQANEPLTDLRSLGERLFFDTRLSGNNAMACATCHQQRYSWTEPLPLGFGSGRNQLPRRTPTLWGAAWQQTFFWDGRASTLEEQAKGPITSAGEMNQNLDELLVELDEDPTYQDAFAHLFNDPNKGITANKIFKALAAFQRTLVPEETPYERWLAGDDGAINHMAQMGFRMFQSPNFKCAKCHSIGQRFPAGKNRFLTSFSDGDFHDIGLPLREGNPDRGRWTQLTEKEKADPVNITYQFAFKTPTLWDVACRAPYMHDGSLATLDDVMDHYSRGGSVLDDEGQVVRRPSHARDVRPLNLNQHQKQVMIEFLKTLSPKPCGE